MARPKEKKTSAEIVKEVFEKEAFDARKARLAAYEAMKKETTDERDQREEFRKFWAVKHRELKRSKDLEEVIWMHFKATGHDKVEKFEDGLKHFGLVK